MVAASKLRMDQQRREFGLPFALPVVRFFSRLSPCAAPSVLQNERPTVFLAISSGMHDLGFCVKSNYTLQFTDKGLCGGVNSSVARLTKGKIAEHLNQGENVRIFAVGEKVRPPLQRFFLDR